MIKNLIYNGSSGLMSQWGFNIRKLVDEIVFVFTVYFKHNHRFSHTIWG